MENIKEKIKEEYSNIVSQSKCTNEKSLCGVGGTCGIDYTIFSENYSDIQGYCPTADLGVGCGIPTQGVSIKEGNLVLDLGCGAGNDCFVARQMVGEKGKVIGLDFTPEMLKKAWENLDKLGYNNVEFRFGDIENMPISSEIVDVVISNCVINLVPDKKKAFSEIFRVLKPGGIFSISDVISTKVVPEKILKNAMLYVGCIAGVMVKDEYLQLISDCGFSYEIKKEKVVSIPDEILLKFFSTDEIKEFKSSGIEFLSVTIQGKKQLKEKESCCSENSSTCK